jgi:N utilization substance protein B
MKGDAPVTVLEALVVPADEFTTRLVSWTQLHGSRADELVAEASLGWALDRMAVVDRLVLRMAVSELLEPEPAGAPAPVVIDEAVELAKTYSTEDSGGFVNGILSAISARVR